MKTQLINYVKQLMMYNKKMIMSSHIIVFFMCIFFSMYVTDRFWHFYTNFNKPISKNTIDISKIGNNVLEMNVCREIPSKINYIINYSCSVKINDEIIRQIDKCSIAIEIYDFSNTLLCSVENVKFKLHKESDENVYGIELIFDNCKLSPGEYVLKVIVNNNIDILNGVDQVLVIDYNRCVLGIFYVFLPMLFLKSMPMCAGIFITWLLVSKYILFRNHPDLHKIQ